MGVRNGRHPRQDPGHLEPVERNRRGVLGCWHLDPAARNTRQFHRLLPVSGPARRQPVLRPEAGVFFGEQVVLDLPVDDSFALLATGFRQDERTVQGQRNNVLIVEPLHPWRDVDDSTVDALADRRVPHAQSLPTSVREEHQAPGAPLRNPVYGSTNPLILGRQTR